MFNNIKWKYSWEIKKGDVNHNGERWLNLTWCRKQSSMLLPTIKQVTINLHGFCEMPKGNYIIEKADVVPGFDMYLMLSNEIDFKQQIQIKIKRMIKNPDTVYAIKIYTFDEENIKIQNSMEYTFCETIFKEKMKAFPAYLEVFPFSLPLGKCFGINEKE